jgi:hypothetical protein
VADRKYILGCDPFLVSSSGVFQRPTTLTHQSSQVVGEPPRPGHNTGRGRHFPVIAALPLMLLFLGDPKIHEPVLLIGASLTRTMAPYRLRLQDNPTISANASSCSTWRETGFSSRWLAPDAIISCNCSRTWSGVPWMPEESVPAGL